MWTRPWPSASGAAGSDLVGLKLSTALTTLTLCLWWTLGLVPPPTCPMGWASLNSCLPLAPGGLVSASGDLWPRRSPQQAPGAGGTQGWDGRPGARCYCDKRRKGKQPCLRKRRVRCYWPAAFLGGQRLFVGKTGREDFQDPSGHPPAARPSFRRFSAASAGHQLPVCLSPCLYVPLTTRPRLPASEIKLPSVFSPAVGVGGCGHLEAALSCPLATQGPTLETCPLGAQLQAEPGAQQAWLPWSCSPTLRAGRCRNHRCG